MGHGLLVRTHGRIAFPLCSSQYRGVEHWIESDGIFFPEHVQCNFVRMDSRSVPSSHQRHCLRPCKFLGSNIWYRVSDHCGAYIGGQPERATIPCRKRSICVDHCCDLDADEVDGCAELLRRILSGYGVLWNKLDTLGQLLFSEVVTWKDDTSRRPSKTAWEALLC